MWADSTKHVRSAETIWTPGKSVIAGGKEENRREIVQMSRSMIELPGGGGATESEALSALAREARRRKTSYGKLVAATTERERAEIIRDYCGQQRRKARRRGK